jgi:hypothetical protein
VKPPLLPSSNMKKPSTSLTAHERLAKLMASTVSVGAHSSYEEILAMLREKIPDETACADFNDLIEKVYGLKFPPGVNDA